MTHHQTGDSSVILNEISADGLKESEQPTPSCSSTSCRSTTEEPVAVKEEPEIKIEMHTTNMARKEEDANKSPSSNYLERVLHEWYVGDEKSCPLTFGIVPARAVALVLAPVHIVLHLFAIVKLHDYGVAFYTFGAFIIICMVAAFLGLCRKRPYLLVRSIFIQLGETVLLTACSVIWFCVLVINITRCVASRAGGESIGMPSEAMVCVSSFWTESGGARAIAFAFYVLITAGAHFFLALFLRAALAMDRRFLA